MKGSRLGNIEELELASARCLLRKVKQIKLLEKAEKHAFEPLKKHKLVDHLFTEIREYIEAVLMLTPDKALEELADISNLADILAMLEVRRKLRVNYG